MVPASLMATEGPPRTAFVLSVAPMALAVFAWNSPPIFTPSLSYNWA